MYGFQSSESVGVLPGNCAQPARMRCWNSPTESESDASPSFGNAWDAVPTFASLSAVSPDAVSSDP
jgi:hypothetical protein